MAASNGSRIAPGLGLLALVAALGACAQKSEFDYLPDHPGKASAKIAFAHGAEYRLSAAERAAVLADLTRLRDRLLAQPSFSPPRGVEVRGEIGSLGGAPRSLNAAAGLLKEPVQAFGDLYYCFYFRDRTTGKPDYNHFSTWELQIAVNNPVDNGPDGFLVGKEQVLREPAKAGEIQGFPLYRNSDGNEFIVLSRTGKPYWLPITREQYVNLWIKVFQDEIAKSGPIPDYMELLKRHKNAIARMSPAERQAQARHLAGGDAYEPPLAPAGSQEGTPLVIVNPQWWNPALPRTAFQLITVKFLYRGDLDPDKPKPTETGLITALRLWETLHTSDWRAVSSVLAP